MNRLFTIRFLSAAVCIFAFAACPIPAQSESAKPQAASPPMIDPKDVTSDTKLTPAMVKPLLNCVNLYNAKDYKAARTSIADLRAIPNRTAYDDFNISNMEMVVASVSNDMRTAAAASEAMAMSSALTDKDRRAVFASALELHAAQKEYWRAIQYGELLRREKLLDGKPAFILPFLYFQNGAFADAEQAAQSALTESTFSKDEREKLTKLVGLSQIKEGKVVPMASSFGDALLQSFGSALVQSTTGEQPNNDPQAQMQEQQAAAADAIQLALKSASGEVLAADRQKERAVYDDLVNKPVPTAAEDARAQAIFKKAFDEYQNQDYASAEKDFAQGLPIDPTNSAANYYYADCLASQGRNSLTVIDYLTRALVLGENTDETKLARTALQQFSSPN
jgi:hypothetical protein